MAQKDHCTCAMRSNRGLDKNDDYIALKLEKEIEWIITPRVRDYHKQRKRKRHVLAAIRGGDKRRLQRIRWVLNPAKLRAEKIDSDRKQRGYVERNNKCKDGKVDSKIKSGKLHRFQWRDGQVHSVKNDVGRRLKAHPRTQRSHLKDMI